MINVNNSSIETGVTVFTKADGTKVRSRSVKSPIVLNTIMMLAKNLTPYERSLVRQLIDG